MPKILEKLRKKIEAQGKDTSSAYAIATSALQKSGYLKEGSTELTKKGSAKERLLKRIK